MPIQGLEKPQASQEYSYEHSVHFHMSGMLSTPISENRKIKKKKATSHETIT